MKNRKTKETIQSEDNRKLRIKEDVYIYVH